jgi:hypothetical protein
MWRDLTSFLANVLHHLIGGGCRVDVVGDFLGPGWIIVHADANVNFASPTSSPRATTMLVSIYAGAGPSNAPTSMPLSLRAPYRVLDRPPSPSPDRSVYRPMEPSNDDASLRGHRGHHASSMIEASV